MHTYTFDTRDTIHTQWNGSGMDKYSKLLLRTPLVYFFLLIFLYTFFISSLRLDVYSLLALVCLLSNAIICFFGFSPVARLVPVCQAQSKMKALPKFPSLKKKLRKKMYIHSKVETLVFSFQYFIIVKSEFSKGLPVSVSILFVTLFREDFMICLI